MIDSAFSIISILMRNRTRNGLAQKFGQSLAAPDQKDDQEGQKSRKSQNKREFHCYKFQVPFATISVFTSCQAHNGQKMSLDS